MDNDTASQKVPREVAAFLLLLHNHYFKDVKVECSLGVMVSWAFDANLLGNRVNMLDLEHIRQKLMKSTAVPSEEIVSYEMFYMWLREVSILVYNDTEDAGLFALHKFLIQYAIPLATAVATKKVKSIIVLRDEIVSIMRGHDAYFRHWYLSLLNELDSNQEGINYPHSVALFRSWTKLTTAKNQNCVSINQIKRSFQYSGWCPRFFPEDVYQLIMSHINGNSEANSVTTGHENVNDNCNLTFHTFLIITYGLFEYVYLSMQPKHIADVLEQMIEVAAENFMQRTLRNFWLSEQFQSAATQSMNLLTSDHISRLQQSVRESLNMSGFMSNNSLESHRIPAGATYEVEDALTLGASSMMWLCRQIGVTTHGSFTFQVDEHDASRILTIEELAGAAWEWIANRSREAVVTDRGAVLPVINWPLRDVSVVIVNLCGTICGVPDDHTGISRTENDLPISPSSVASLVKICPAALFAVPLQQSSPLTSLYSLRTPSLIYNQLRGRIDYLVSKCTLSNDTDGIDEVKRSQILWDISVKKLITYFESMSVIPRIIRISDLLKVTEKVVEFDISLDYEQADVALTRGYLLESLYSLSQLVFENDEMSAELRSYCVRHEPKVKVFDDPFLRFRTFIKYCTAQYKEVCGDNLDGASPSVDRDDIDTGRSRDRGLNQLSGENAACLSMYVPIHNGDKFSTALGPIDELAGQFQAGPTTGFGLFCLQPESDIYFDWQRALADIEILIIHVPLNDLRLNPWSVGSIFTSSLRLMYSAKDLQLILSKVFQSVLHATGLTAPELRRYFETVCLRDPSPIFILRPAVRVAIADREIRLMMDETILRLLRSNCDLLRWEFSRCSATYRSTNPFSAELVAPIPSSTVIESRADDVVVTSRAALSWAYTTAEIPEDRAAIQLENTLNTAGLVNEGGVVHGFLTFSMFIAFAVRCFNDHAFFGGRIPIRGRTDEDLSVATSAVRQMLQKLSDHLSAVQLGSGLRLLKPLFGRSSDELEPCLDKTTARSLCRRMVLIFDSYYTYLEGTEDPDLSFLPKSIPTQLWDAPRFMEFCKMFGLSSSVGSSVTLWRSFGYTLRSVYYTASTRLIEWAQSVVPSLSIKCTSEAVLTLVDSLAKHVDPLTWAQKASDGSSVGLQQLLIQATVPMVAAHVDFRISHPTSSRAKPKSGIGTLQLQDILRYGGDWLMESLKNSRASILVTYKNLIQAAGTEIIGEPPVSLVTRYLSCHGLLEVSGAARQLKLSLHPRLRKLKVTSVWPPVTDATAEEVTISLVELEEALIRCAFVAWITSGASQGGAFPACFHPVSGRVSRRVVQRYCNECLGIGDDLAERANSFLGLNPTLFGGRAGSWGVDFLLPYLRTLQAYGRIPNPTKPPDGFVLGTTNASKILLPLPIVNAEAKKSNNLVQFYSDYSPLPNSVECSSQQYEAYLTNEAPQSTQGHETVDDYNHSTFPELSNKKFSPVDDCFNEANKIHGTPSGMYSSASDSPLFTSLTAELSPDVQNFNQRSDSKQAMDPELLSNRIHILNKSNSSVLQSSGPGIDSTTQNSNLTATVMQPNRDILPTMEYAKALISSSDVLAKKEALLQNILASRIVSDAAPQSATDVYPKYNPSYHLKKLDARASSRESNQERFTNDHMMPRTVIPMQASTHSRIATALPSRPYRLTSPMRTPNSDLLDSTREALWPVYATFCSCADSSDPGKLSGPNLFALLASLGALTNETTLSAIGMLIHQVSAHTMAQLPVTSAPIGRDDVTDSPSLSFEEFLIFLCVFAHLRFKDSSVTPLFPGRSDVDPSASDIDDGWQHWYDGWMTFMGSSASFKRLLEQCVLPPLQRNLLLASPEDARHRDRYCDVFSLEALLALQGLEPRLRSRFERGCGKTYEQPAECYSKSSQAVALVSLLQQLKLVPQMLSKVEIVQLISDVQSVEYTLDDRAGHECRHLGMIYPQWEWVLGVASLKAVTTAMSEVTHKRNREAIGTYIADVIHSIGEAIAMK